MFPGSDAQDPYSDPTTGVLLNRLNINDPVLLTAVETDLTFARMIWLDENRIEGDYDLPHLQAFHRSLFGDIYPWAGQLRTVNISRMETFCLPHFLETAGADVFANIQKDSYLRNLSRHQFVERLAYHLAEVNALHPFREGNGRTQRAFFRQLARDAGWKIRWSRLDREQNEDASRASLLGDISPLLALIDPLVERM